MNISRAIVILATSIVFAAAFAADEDKDAKARVASMTGDRARDSRVGGAATWEEIAAEGRPAAAEVVPPPEGMFIGAGVRFGGEESLTLSGANFTKWTPNRPKPEEAVARFVAEGLGNTIQFIWVRPSDVMHFARIAKERGLFSIGLYSDPLTDVAADIAALGRSWVGYDYGERFHFNFDGLLAARRPDLKTAADEYMRRVHTHVKDRHAAGWGNVMATSAEFALDYQVAAGAEIPLVEDYPFGDLNLSSAMSRGLYRQYALPTWGTHLAHEWFSYLPHTNPLKTESMAAALRLKYMAGAKIAILETGLFHLNSTICPDSPMLSLPSTDGCPPGVYKGTDPRAGGSAELLERARRDFSYIDSRSPVSTKYRRIMADFTAFCREHPAPKGQPEVTLAVVKGNYDLCGSAWFRPGWPIGGASSWATKDMRWYSGAPESSWLVALGELLPQPPMFAPNANVHFSATPYGQVDVVSFACDNVDASWLARNYRALVFAGWNTCSERQYRVLCGYVKAGGRLLVALPHLSTNRARNYMDYGVEELVNGGDFTELCGVKVKGRGRLCYWATGPSSTPNGAGFVARRRFGIVGSSLGDLELVGDAGRFEKVVVDDEKLRPIVLRCKSRKGEVFLVNTWSYPALVNDDMGPGLEAGNRGFMSRLYAYVAKLSRGRTWITGPDMENPDEDCRWIAHSYFPDGGKVCLMNLDQRGARTCVLHWFGEKDFIELKPGEFRLMDAPALKPHEKLNER